MGFPIGRAHVVFAWVLVVAGAAHADPRRITLAVMLVVTPGLTALVANNRAST
jgi:hypothetical protein